MITMNENSINIDSEENIIDVSVAEPEWKGSYLDLEDVARKAMLLALKTARLPKIMTERTFEASIVLANDDLIQVLNREYRDMDKPTNVLSFATIDSDDPLPEEGPFPLGDIILSYQTLDREAREQGKFFKDHFTHMVVHGTLHLIGYDHQTEDEANIMETLEIRILEKLNIQNPYMENFSVA